MHTNVICTDVKHKLELEMCLKVTKINVHKRLLANH